MSDYRSDIVEQLRDASTAEKESYEYMILAGFAADEVERLRERIEELKPYEVVSGDTWKARVSHEQLMEQTAQMKLLTHTIDTLNTRIKHLQAKIKGYEADISAPAEPKSSPESEGVSG
jgi:hypothetical protein